MTKTPELPSPGEISEAARRMMHLLESGYLPARIESDLELILRAALAWQVFRERSAPEVMRTDQ